MTTRLIFLGTGGGRFVTIRQTRATGGIYLIDGNARMHIDPGPGALLMMHRYSIDPFKSNAILVSHCHPDHYIDAEILIEAMTRGCTMKHGTLLASESIIKGVPQHGPAISSYHRSIVNKCYIIHPGDKTSINNVRIEVIPAFHSDPSGVGFKFFTKEGIIIWGSDTYYSEKLLSFYAGSRILILSVTTPLGVRIPFHLNTEDAANIALKTKPELCIITHFGVNMLKSNVLKQAKWIEKTSGVKTIPAKDGLIIELNEGIRFLDAMNIN